MATITLKGNTINTVGNLPANGAAAPDFKLTKTDLSEISLKDFAGKKVVLNIFPSIDTPTCATAARKFNEKANSLDNTVILCVSADLPFALNRFCAAEGLQNIIPASVFRNPEFGEQYGVKIVDGPIAGLLSRAIVVIDADGKVIHTEQVSEVANEPDYEKVIQKL